MLAKVKVSAGVNALNLFETEWHVELNVCCCIGIVSKFVMVMETIVLCSEAKVLMPLHTCLFPLGKPIKLSARLDEELHLHLLKLTHTEDELTRYYLIAECLTNLSDSERKLHATCLLHVEVIDKDTLRCFRTKIYFHCTISAGSHLCREHEVELTHVSPVLSARNRTNDFLVDDYLLQCFKVRSLHRFLETMVEFIIFLLVFQYTRVGLAELYLVESVAKLLLCLCYFLCYLILIFCHLLFYENISAVTLFGVTVVNQRVIESIYVTRSLPDSRVHEDSRVYSYDIVVEEYH